MEYEEIKLLTKSEKSTVYLVCSGGQNYIRKVLTGQHPVYEVLKDNPHPCLPRLLDVIISEDSTTVLEEYIEGQSLGTVKLSKRQFSTVVRELCSVLTFLHGKGIIHRDIKPSNILLTGDGHIRLIDFDIARMHKDDLKQDTRLLGTRGFASPEQYGFSQTDERTDIYALGITLKLLLTEMNQKNRYKKILRKCTNLDPDKRYQTVEQFRRDFFPAGRNLLLCGAAVCLSVLVGICVWKLPALVNEETAKTKNAAPPVLPMPQNVHWDGETAIASWDNVPEAKAGNEVQFMLRLYRQDTAAAPDPESSDWCYEELVRFGNRSADFEVINWNIVTALTENGFYYFTVSAVGDGIQYADSPYAVSDAFEYTGEDAPPLPTPEGLAWRLVEGNEGRFYYATWTNLDDYVDDDSINVTFYDETGAYVMNNTWQMRAVLQDGHGGIYIRPQFLTSKPGSKYRFTVQAYSSRPNEYSSSPMPDPVPEEYYSPWLIFGQPEGTDMESSAP